MRGAFSGRDERPPRACSRRPRAGRSSSTRSARCRSRPRPRSSARSRSSRSAASATAATSPWTSGSSRPRTSTSRRPSRAGRSATTCYYRLAVVTLWVPPLRDRGEDRLLLADHFLRMFSGKSQFPRRLSTESRDLVLNDPFPGNVRELKHAIEQACALTPRDELQPDDFPLLLARADAASEGRSAGGGVRDATPGEGPRDAAEDGREPRRGRQAARDQPFDALPSPAEDAHLTVLSSPAQSRAVAPGTSATVAASPSASASSRSSRTGARRARRRASAAAGRWAAPVSQRIAPA